MERTYKSLSVRSSVVRFFANPACQFYVIWICFVCGNLWPAGWNGYRALSASKISYTCKYYSAKTRVRQRVTNWATRMENKEAFMLEYICCSLASIRWRISPATEKSFSKSYFEEEKESNQEIEPISDICFDEPKISHVLVHDPPNPRQ